jgi:hypothetical protein
LIIKKAYIEFTRTVSRIYVGNEAIFKINFYGFQKKSIVWSTSKKDIAMVGKNNGKTTAIVVGTSPGADIIYVKAKGKGGTKIYAKYKVTIIE